MTSIDWDALADSFDQEPDHGLLDSAVRMAWADRMRDWLPREPSQVLDLGCGTGTLALLAAEQGHRVTGVDLSPAMAGQARAKLAGREAEILVGDAARPPVGERTFDVILARHVLWLLPDPGAVLRHWATLLRPGGRFVLIEGVWSGTGLAPARLMEALAPLTERVHYERLSADHELWGRPVDDERYVVVAQAARPGRHTEVVDVHLILRRGDDVLLARRAGTGYGDGLLNGPSGHVEAGEDVRAAMIREADEEIGVELAPEDLKVALVMQHRGPGGGARIGWFFEAEYGRGGEPYNREPQKCSGLSWHPLADLPADMVAYCRAGLEAYRAGERFLIHRHEDHDPIAYAPDRPTRAVPLPATTGGALHHIELWVPDLPSAEARWGWLLGELGYAPYRRWDHGRSFRRADTYVVIEQSPGMRPGAHDRRAPGLNHLAFHAADRTALDALVARAPDHGWTLLYGDRHPFAGGEDHYAAYLEDPAGYEVELVAPATPVRL
ncbi:trifunctional class I SAM-dependent methyltransferase/NUDIX hydrolase/VOC family protein [Streptomyces liangshanensis]|uniref:Methyltransferase domain-containing protein n=1 Tax=Streptomyces liangshanensis TaxID=2717324 RepID=A0A6G9H5L1_9ACTN|nr:trifunctional class I SAM-dependent methyltransferase/NUDIX hydrolase/VOC family protein [Streptomyces liangshanensis]QIQ05521.1 methyltransferase domain-containing protein [Streptomyces liangshanensis]